MPRSSRHRSHKQSKHSSKDYSDSEEDARMKDKSSRDENLVKTHRDSASGEKRKISSREGKDGKDPNGIGNGEASGDYFPPKRQKEKTDIGDGGDRWNGGGEERGNSDRIVEKVTIKGDNSKNESKLKEVSNKGESLKMEWKNKDKKYESGTAGEVKSSIVTVEKQDIKSKGEPKRKSERDSSGQKEGKEYKGKDRRAIKENEKDKVKVKEKEKDISQVSKRGDAKTNLVDVDVVKKQEVQSGDHGIDRKVKRGQENTDFPVNVELQNPELEKDVDNRIHKRRESSSNRGKHHDEFKEGDERGLSSRGDHAKVVKYKDDRPKDRIYVDKYHVNEDDHKIDGQRDEKYHEEMKNDNKRRDGKHKEDVGKDAKSRDDRHRGDGDRDNKHKSEKCRDDGEKDTNVKDDKYREGAGRCKDYRHHEDSERDSRRMDDRYRDDGEKSGRDGDVKRYENGDRDDRHRENNYREDSRRDNVTKEERHRGHIERESRYKESKQVDDFDREKRPREVKYNEELDIRDYSGDKSDPRHSNDGGYAGDHHFKHSSTHDDSAIHDDRTVRYRDDQGRRRTTEKQDDGGVRSRNNKGQRFDSEKRSGNEARVDSVPDREKSTSRNADMELNLTHSKRRRSPSSSSLAPRDNYRLKQDEYKHREYSSEERLRHNMTSGRDYAMGGSEKTSSWSLEKLGQKEDGRLRELSAERRLKSDIRSSPLKLLDKSPSSNTDRRQFNKPDVRRNVDIEELMQRNGGSREDNTVKEGREAWDLAMDVLPRDENSTADGDTLSVSSPFTRNSHLSGSSKSFPPLPPLRAGVGSLSMSGSFEDDSRFNSNNRHRRSGIDPSLGRIQGNPWRCVPSWPSTVPNGFMSFPHPPPPVSFHSVMHPFPAPVMFGIRPPMDSNHPAPYHIPDSDRFSGPVRPMGWHNPVDDSCNPLQSWEASNAVFRDEVHNYGRPGWDHSRSLPGGRGWDTTGNLWKGPSDAACLEMPSHGRENEFSLNINEVLAAPAQSIQQTQNEQILPDEQAAINDVNQSTNDSKIIYVDAPNDNLEDTSYLDKISKKDDVPLCLVYLSKLDISADLTEPELFSQCRGLIDMDQSIISDMDDLKILFIEKMIEVKVAPHQILRSSLSATVDDSVFQKAISLYESKKGRFGKVINGENFLSNNIPFTEPDHEDLNIEENKNVKQSSTMDMQDGKDALSHMIVEFTPPNTSSDAEAYTESTHQNMDLPPANTMVKSEEPVSTVEHDHVTVDSASKVLPKDQILEERLSSVESIEGFHDPLPSEVKNDGNIEDVKSGVTSYGTLLNSDVCSEAMTPELVVSESLLLSRIHHSPESTH